MTVKTDEFLCQSCGSYFPAEGFHGRNADGSLNGDYCKYCWVEGRYGNPDETIEQMCDSCAHYMIKSDKNPYGYPDIETANRKLMERLVTLKRWKV